MIVGRTEPAIRRHRQLWVDNRYGGRHGIGRYANEVVGRLTVDWKDLGARGRPASLRDVTGSRRHIDRGDVVYSPGYACSPTPKTQIITLHDLIHLKVRGTPRLRYWAYYEGLIKPAVKRAKVVLTVSETSARGIRTWLDDDSVKVVNAGNACSDVFRPDDDRHLQDSPYLLFVGNLREHKNPHIAVATVAKSPDLSLRMLVPLNEAAAAQGIAEYFGIGDRVEVLSGIDDDQLAREYRGALATIMPSSLEGFGLPALESVCSGTPVVYWGGCQAIEEASLGRGYAVGELSDIAEWLSIVEAIRDSPRVAPLPERPHWGSVASCVQNQLEIALVS